MRKVLVFALASLLLANDMIEASTSSNSISIVNNPSYQSPLTSNNFDLNISTSDNWQMYNPAWEINPYSQFNTPFWTIGQNQGFSLGNLEAGVGNEFYLLSNQIQGLINNFLATLNPSNLTAIALPFMLWTLGTYFPILKEALVGADNISKQMSMVAENEMNTQLKSIYNMLGSVSRVVRSCIAYNISGGQYSNLTTSQISSYIDSNGQQALQQIIDNCMGGKTLIQAFNNNATEIQQFLNTFNPRNWVSPNFATELNLTQDTNGNYYLQLTPTTGSYLIPTIQPKYTAKLLLTALLPQYTYNANTQQIQPALIYIQNSNGQNVLVSPYNTHNVIKASINTQIDNALQNIGSSDWGTFYTTYIQPLDQALNLTQQNITTSSGATINSTNLDNDWHVLWFLYQQLNALQSQGATNTAQYVELQEIVSQMEHYLKGIYQDIETIEVANEYKQKALELEQKIEAKTKVGQNVPS